ncbi:hypothetical protein ACTAF0_09075 [Streptomyces murinus]|uniref:hypothetical protein n=1 Tax=Streptomyces murinus TaxID=33900 RepID=UPI003F45F1D1
MDELAQEYRDLVPSPRSGHLNGSPRKDRRAIYERDATIFGGNRLPDALRAQLAALKLRLARTL